MDGCWNPWHGCQKYSEGCLNCYVYRRDATVGRESSEVARTAEFDLPVKKRRDGGFKLEAGSHVYACMTSDFFLPDADAWREGAWRMIRARPDVSFSIITKRILRMADCLPADWGEGYENVEIGLTCENQRRADERMDAPIDLGRRLDGRVRVVVAGGESGPNARELRYEWVLSLREQCREAGVGFYFKQTGANFVKDGKRYKIERRLQMAQAKKAKIDLMCVSSPT